MTVNLYNNSFKKVRVGAYYKYVLTMDSENLMLANERKVATNQINGMLGNRNYNVNCENGTRVHVYISPNLFMLVIRIDFSDEDATIIKLKGDPELVAIRKNVAEILSDIGLTQAAQRLPGNPWRVLS